MKSLKFMLIVAIVAGAISNLKAADDSAKTKRFYGGELLCAQVKPDDPSSPVTIENVSPFNPKSRITSDIGWALVTVSMDMGRSLGMYDYSLIHGKQVYPCVALMNSDGSFDGGKWEIKKTKSGRKYSMLFKVQIPPKGKPDYSLRFNLLQNKWKDIPLPFVNVKQKPFIPLKDILATGILGENPYKPKPSVPEPPDESDKAEKNKKPGKNPEEAKKEAPKKKLTKEDSKKAKGKEWETMLGDIKYDGPSPEAKKETDDKKKQEEAKKNKAPKDAWDDWK